MAIVENFYNGDRARNIREVLTKNFANVAKYIPNNFISLTTIERQNLPDDYKVHFKFVFDKEQEYVYRWSEVERSWSQYLIRAKDEYARAEADTNTEMAFADARLGTNLNGQADPYSITFYNRKQTVKDSIFLTAANIKYDDEYSTQTIIAKILADLTSLDNFVGDRNVFLNNGDIIATTVTGALNEINQKTIDNKLRIDDIVNGNTVVPKAEHANEADHALAADKASDSDKLGGQLPSYYATKSELNATNDELDALTDRVMTNESNISELQDDLLETKTDLSALTDRVDVQEDKVEGFSEVLATQGGQLEELETQMAALTTQIGWEILV